jgi:type VI secretion system protein ImpF
MPELTLQERLQPSLLDRLTDDAPHEQKESRLQRVLTLTQLRDGVLRDLGWLLNCCNLECTDDLTAFPYVADAVLNYGIPDLAGLTVKTVDVHQLELAVRKAVLRFEPRLLAGSVKVRATAIDETMSRNSLTFFIEGELWAQPMPLQMFLKTEVDLELGNVTVVEQTE